jgi:uncharacterized protein YbdZ (MbtH family)
VSINPFDDDRGSLLALLNDEEQHGLWPASADVRADCPEYIGQNWTGVVDGASDK